MQLKQLHHHLYLLQVNKPDVKVEIGMVLKIGNVMYQHDSSVPGTGVGSEVISIIRYWLEDHAVGIISFSKHRQAT